MEPITNVLRAESPESRQQFIVKTFTDCFDDVMRAESDAWRSKFRKMASTPFAFYRGSACMFYADVARDLDPFLNEKTSRVWIQGDLHAENFGTYLNSEGILVFDVNDFDEAYVGPFTWDMKRFAASLALIGYQKALSDDEIRHVIQVAARGYVKRVKAFAEKGHADGFALTIASTTGKLQELINETRLESRYSLLESLTSIENYDRRFTINKINRPIDKMLYQQLETCFEEYLETIPKRKRKDRVNYNIKDIVEVQGAGIGSAGFKIYSFLLEGPTQTLENDVIVSMKQGQVASASRVQTDASVGSYFQHHGHRTCLSQRALQVNADPWLGYNALNGIGYFVSEFSPYTADLNWDGINKMDDILELVDFLGQAIAKIHCVSDDDSDHTLVPYSTEEAIYKMLQGKEDAFVDEMVRFGIEYGDIVRDDYRLFVDAFRNHMFPQL